MRKCDTCIHERVCDKWWLLLNIVDIPPNDELYEFNENVSNCVTCELYEE